MKRDNTPWRPVEAASLRWDDAANPISTRFDDYYYSSTDGLEESRYVFLQGNDLPRRWLQERSNNFCIAETGFGSGLNFLLTWQAWRELPQPRPQLHYLSVEKFPLARDDIKRALAPWSTLAALADEFLAQYPGLVPGQHRLQLEGGALTLDLWWEDVTQALPDLASQGLPMVDAWYLDGFTPARNEAMWQPSVLHAVAQLSRTPRHTGTRKTHRPNSFACITVRLISRFIIRLRFFVYQRSVLADLSFFSATPSLFL